ncbi:hypothetical protein [Lentzea sp. NPDC004782]|uniref:hypothetical protein n=1 Tax=Lentzea sp. NPDC004782 TaxID=3154458 RepID=UPI0033A34F8C
MRMLIWTPSNAAELQKSMHDASIGPAALIPVQSGTVLLFSPRSRQLDALGAVARACRITGTRAVAAVWNSDSAIVYPAVARVSLGWSWGSAAQVQHLSTEANRHGPVGRWYQRVFGKFSDFRDRDTAQATYVERFAKAAPQADLNAVADLLRAHHDGAAVVPKLFTALGLPDVAQVAGLVEQGRADQWLETLAPPGLPSWFGRAQLLFCLVAVFLLFALPTPVWVKFVVVVLMLSFFGLAGVVRKGAVARKPINTVLPVIPVTQGAAPTD